MVLFLLNKVKHPRTMRSNRSLIQYIYSVLKRTTIISLLPLCQRLETNKVNFLVHNLYLCFSYMEMVEVVTIFIYFVLC